MFKMGTRVGGTSWKQALGKCRLKFKSVKMSSRQLNKFEFRKEFSLGCRYYMYRLYIVD